MANADGFTRFERIDRSPNTVNYFWGTDSGIHSTSRELARNSLASGVITGFVFSVNEIPTSVVVTSLPTSHESFIKGVTEQFSSYASRHPDQPSISPVFDSLVDTENIMVSEEKIEEALRVFKLIRNMYALDLDEFYANDRYQIG